MEDIVCGECGAQLADSGKTCRMLLDEIVLWEFEDYLGAGHVHLLTILCYNLQHPRIYSREGLEYGKGVLMDTVAAELVTLEDVQARRPIDLTTLVMGATPTNTASYDSEITWPMTLSDVVSRGRESYSDAVRMWGISIFQTLKATGNL